ncbi:MAG: nitroreductase family protein [Clostridiales bacterium]|nr:nitroreductase family protein [Clostridiales bacterium]
MDILEAMEARTSVRTYAGEPLSTEHIEAINAAMSCATSRLPGRYGMELQRFELTGPNRPGTYGVISGACDFLLLGFDEHDMMNAVSAGWAMEQVVLACTQMGLSTCWMTGTYKSADFGIMTHFPDGMELQAVIPVGIGAGKTRFLERFTRYTMGSKNRKPMGKLFFVGEWWNPMTDSSQFYESLMMMRLAPSSTNSQPWRAVIKGDTVHFYSKGESKNHMIDMGIGFSHFDMTERYRDQSGSWLVSPTDAPAPAAGMTYVASYKRL